ncbi:TetR/AcrR family transcriptional regulator [Pimelobacter simplex]|uniref:TetR/AcrR family transcriptional regulator n=1 Tax=Nocardioides simplex TaxID=2045 RepID=UPI001933D61B|nr:TetR/AcrR family transcriptional regulator [Pimelobacter simplex]
MGADHLPSGRHGLTPEQVREDQRRRLLSATAICMAERGYTDTSVADIIERAGVSRKTFYELFADKADAFSAAYETGVAGLMHDVGEAIGPDGTWHERVVRGLTALAESVARSPAFATLCIMEVWAAGDAARRRHFEVVAGFRTFLDELSDEVSEQLFSGIVGALSTMLYHEIDEGRVEQLTEIVPDMVAFVEPPLEAVRARKGGRSGS